MNMKRSRILALSFCLPLAPAIVSQPVNDEPCGAIPLLLNDTCNAVFAVSVDATVSSGTPPILCTYDTVPDVWFSFTAPTGVVSITMGSFPFQDGAMALYVGDSCDGDLMFIACSFTMGGVPRFQRSDLQPGATYWIRAYYPNDADPGEFPICATGPTEFPPGDCVYLLETYANGGNGWQGATVAATINGVVDST